MGRKKTELLLALGTAMLLGGCADLAWYAQAVGGHWQVMRSARPIPEWLADPATEPSLKAKLGEIQAMREFASRELDLPDNGSYRSYADLKRPYVVWNVFAAAEFSLEPRHWCFPVAGCVNYRGYYDRAGAESVATELSAKGMDTWVGGVPAYSTLGHFDDPVLNTFLRLGQEEVARTLFHELAHQLLYVPGDTAFNESFATAVEEVGMERWLVAQGRAEKLADFQRRQRQRVEFTSLVDGYRLQLGQLYDQKAMAPEDKRQAKAQIIAELRRDYAAWKGKWGGFAGFDAWMAGPLNNAQLASVNLYQRWLPAFRELLRGEGGELSTFYRRARELAAMNDETRNETLEKLTTARP